MTEWILEVMAAGGYWGIALLMALENVFPPIPSEVIMGMAGIGVARGTLGFWPVMLFGTVGTTIGNMIWYEAGRRMGYHGLQPFVRRWGRWLTLDWDDVETLIAFFRKHGHHVVFWLRFSPFMRTMISLPAGMAGMDRTRFVIFTTAGSSIWNAILIGAGYYFGTNFRHLEHYTGPVVVAVAALALVAYLWRVITWKPRDKR